MKTQTLLAVAVISAMTQFGCKGDDDDGGGCGFKACGGDINGTWTLDSEMCVEGDLSSALVAEAGLPAACNGLYQDVQTSFAGTVTYANGTETANLTVDVTMLTRYTSACLSAIAGTTVPMLSATCDQLVASMLDSGEFESVTCTLAGSACDCTAISPTETISETDTYTLSGNTLTYSGGSTVDYCVSGNTLSERSSSGFGDVYSVMRASR